MKRKTINLEKFLELYEPFMEIEDGVKKNMSENMTCTIILGKLNPSPLNQGKV